MIGSTIVAEARPVLSVPNSWRSEAMAPSIRRSRSSMSMSMSSDMGLSVSFPAVPGAVTCSSGHSAFARPFSMKGASRDRISTANQRVSSASGENAAESAGFVEREHDDRQPVVAGERDGRGVHHAEVPLQHLVVAHGVIALGVGELLGVLVVDAVDLGALEDRLAVHLVGAQRRGGVGGEIGVAGAGGEDADALLLQVPDSAAADVGL